MKSIIKLFIILAIFFAYSIENSKFSLEKRISSLLSCAEFQELLSDHKIKQKFINMFRNLVNEPQKFRKLKIGIFSINSIIFKYIENTINENCAWSLIRILGLEAAKINLLEINSNFLFKSEILLKLSHLYRSNFDNKLKNLSLKELENIEVNAIVEVCLSFLKRLNAYKFFSNTANDDEEVSKSEFCYICKKSWDNGFWIYSYAQYAHKSCFDHLAKFTFNFYQVFEECFINNQNQANLAHKKIFQKIEIFIKRNYECDAIYDLINKYSSEVVKYVFNEIGIKFCKELPKKIKFFKENK